MSQCYVFSSVHLNASSQWQGCASLVLLFALLATKSVTEVKTSRSIVSDWNLDVSYERGDSSSITPQKKKTTTFSTLNESKTEPLSSQVQPEKNIRVK